MRRVHRILRRFSGGQSGKLFDVRESRRQRFLSFATFEPFGVGAGGCPGKGRESLRLCVQMPFGYGPAALGSLKCLLGCRSPRRAMSAHYAIHPLAKIPEAA